MNQFRGFYVRRNMRVNLLLSKDRVSQANNPQQSWGFEGEPPEAAALANSLAFADFCGAARRNARRIVAIADFLSLVFAQRRRE